MGSSGYAHASALEVLGIEVGSGRAWRFTRLKSRVRKASKRAPRLRAARKADSKASRLAKQ
eukprot:5200800-Pyramimonas_sp.AAC.1